MGSKKPCPGCGEVVYGRAVKDVCRKCEVLLERAGWMEEQLSKLDDDEIVVSFGRVAHWNEYIHTHSGVGRDLMDDFQRVALAGSRPSLTYKAEFDLLGPIEFCGAEHAVMFRSLAEAVRDLWKNVQNALQQEYKQGKKDGSNLLKRLADGDLAVNEFDVKIEKM